MSLKSGSTQICCSNYTALKTKCPDLSLSTTEELNEKLDSANMEVVMVKTSEEVDLK